MKLKIRNNKYARFYCASALLAAGSFAAIAEEISGTVFDKDGEPMIGATVMVEGTRKAVVVDIDGKFNIDADPGQSLKITYVGMMGQTVKVQKGKTTYEIILQSDDQTLEQVVVVGYGTMEKKRVTSSITSISGDNLMTGLGGSTVATALQGKVSGLTIGGSSSPNSTNDYQLRGVSSVKAGNSPLVVIDGIPGGDLRAVNQEDIESIDVLKDASAGAIYGTRASAGVILVTTKKAKEGKATVTYNMELSVESARKRLETLNSQEYIELGRGYDYGYDTDWYHQLTRNNPFSHRHSVTMTGGTKALQLYSSLSYSDQKGIVIGDGRKDYSARLNGRYSLWDNRLQIGLRMQYREAHRDQRNSAGAFEQALALNPTTPLMDPENPFRYNVNQYGIGTLYNPVANINDQEYSGTDQWFMGDANIKFEILPGFNIQATAGVDRRQWVKTLYYNQYHRYSVNSGKLGQGSHSYSKSMNLSYEAYASYTKDFLDDHHIDAVAGWSFFEEKGTEAFSMTNRNFIVDGVGPWDMGAGSDLTDGYAEMSSSKSARERLMSYFARVNYSYDDKYIATVSYRREGSSKFGKNHRWGNFWSVSAGWRLNREKFLQDVEWLNDLKLRVGYGVTGNNNFGSGYTVRNYDQSGMFPNPGGVWVPAYGSARNINPDLKWEEKKELNVGVDFSFFGGRLSGKFDWFNRRVDDMLFSVTAPVPPMVQKTVMKNVGTLDNKGWEFELSGRIFQQADFDWDATVRFSQSSSKIKNLGEAGSQILSDALPSSMGYTHKIVNGQEIGKFWLFKYAGLDENGKWLIYDKDNNIVPAAGNTTDENKHYVGNGVPKLIFSMDHNFRYKNFDLGISCRSWIKYDVFDETELYYGLKGQQGINVLKSAYGKNAAINDNRITTDYFLQDATFFKIDAISLGYTLDLSKWQKYVSSARFYVTARDVATFTRYKGYNPEQNVNGLFPGLAGFQDVRSMYPQTIRWTFGMQLKF